MPLLARSSARLRARPSCERSVDTARACAEGSVAAQMSASDEIDRHVTRRYDIVQKVRAPVHQAAGVYCVAAVARRRGAD